MTDHDPVNSPNHYTSGGIECIDAIEAALTPEEASGFRKGNALKYIWRAGKKGDYEQDLAKADWYLERERVKAKLEGDKTKPQPPEEDLLEIAWGIIANGNGGDWDAADPEWRRAAERWRDEYFSHCGIKRPNRTSAEEDLDTRISTSIASDNETNPDTPHCPVIHDPVVECNRLGHFATQLQQAHPRSEG